MNKNIKLLTLATGLLALNTLGSLKPVYNEELTTEQHMAPNDVNHIYKPRATDSDLVLIAKTYRNLVGLDLSIDPRVTIEGLKKFISECRKLETISITCPKNVSQEELEELYSLTKEEYNIDIKVSDTE